MKPSHKDALKDELVKVVAMVGFTHAPVSVHDIAMEMRYRRNVHRFTPAIELGQKRINYYLNQLAAEARIVRHEPFKYYSINVPVRYGPLEDV
jgi:hypothetical protein